MPISLGSTIHTDMMACMMKFSSKLTAVGDRVDHIETKMGEFETTIIDLVNGHDSIEDGQNWLKAKLPDLEDQALLK